MTLGIMQPYFFPYLGYFQLILAVDRGVVFDIVQYRRKSWMNRNRVLHPTLGWQYVSVPVHAPLGTPINAALIVDGAAALRRILGQLAHYRGKAPFFPQVSALVSEAFAVLPSGRISELNLRSLSLVCDYLGIRFDWSVCSDLALELPMIEHAGRWALEISSALGAARYVNAPGGRDLFPAEEWLDRGIELRFLKPAPFVYASGPYEPVENLSVLDVLMWNDPAQVRHHLVETLEITA
jgi:hypothetical protein